MKVTFVKSLFCISVSAFCFPVFSQTAPAAPSVNEGELKTEAVQAAETAVQETAETVTAAADDALNALKPEENTAEAETPAVSEEDEEAAEEIEVVIPEAKRPKAQDSAKIEELDNTDSDGRRNNGDIIKYGLESDIIDLLDTLVSKKDVRFVNEVYDLFQETKSDSVREKILFYFKALEDPCLEDYAVTVLDDPYDEKKSIVDACFSYVQGVKTKEAVPAAKKLLEGDDQQYFLNSIETIGKAGGSKEAVYLSKYLEKEELTLPERQALVRSLGSLHAVQTYDTLVGLAEDEEENSFIRAYSAEAIGEMKKEEAVPVLENLYESEDPTLRASVIKGISNFDNDASRKIIIQGIKDSHQKVRKEAVEAAEKLKVTEADEYLIYRAKNDKESSVKKACYEALAVLGTAKGDEYLLGELSNKKTGDNTKLEITRALLKNEKGTKEIVSLAGETVSDDRRKQLRYALGKEMAKTKNQDFADICLKYIESKDNATCGTGLDMYAMGRYSNCDSAVKALAEKADLNAPSKNQLAIKAAKILGMDLDKMTAEKDAERERQAALKKEKGAAKTASDASNAK